MILMKFIRKLFSGKSTLQDMESSTTAPLTEKQIQSIMQGPKQQDKYEVQQLIAASGQSVGKQRELNEDSILALTATLAGNSGSLPFGLYIVADGMGGHQFGEVASNAAVRIVADHIMKKFKPYLFSLQPSQPDESLQEIMQNAVVDTQKTIQAEAPGSGTTLTAALVLGNQVTVAHIGDSRAYHIYPDGRAEVITRDHSLVMRLEELGHISPDEAENYPHRNVLYRALGQGDNLEADVFTLSLPQAGYLMLCSDGLWGVVSDLDMVRLIKEAPNMHVACQNLVEAANAAGGPDNISVVLVQLIG